MCHNPLFEGDFNKRNLEAIPQNVNNLLEIRISWPDFSLQRNTEMSHIICETNINL